MTKTIIGVTGLHGAGKTLLTEQLAQIIQADNFSARILLGDLLKEQGKESNRETQHVLANELREEEGSWAIAARQFARVKESTRDLAIIESFRSMAEVDWMQEQVRAIGGTFFLLACDESLEVRLKRQRGRDGENDQRTPLQLIEAENKELFGHSKRQRIFECLMRADAYVRIPTDATLEPMRQAIRLIQDVLIRGRLVPDNPFIATANEDRRRLGSYVHVIPANKLGVFAGSPYKQTDGTPGTFAQSAYFLAQRNILPVSDTRMHAIAGMFGDERPALAFLQPSHTDGAQYYTVLQPKGGVLRYTSDKPLPPDAYVPYLVPWV